MADKKPSEYLRQHLSGSGIGFEIDDLMSRHEGDPAYQAVIDQILAIEKQFRTREYPVGISNPDADASLTALADWLEAEGN